MIFIHVCERHRTKRLRRSGRAIKFIGKTINSNGGRQSSMGLKLKLCAPTISTQRRRVLTTPSPLPHFSGSSGCLISTYRNGDFAMKIRPLHDRVNVKRMEEDRKTASVIVIDYSSTEKPDQGEVIAVGAGKKDDQGKLIPLDVKVGDRVLFGKYAGQTVKVEGDELLVLREEDIMDVIEQ